MVRDSIPTGYKLMWGVPHSEEGSTLDQLTKRNRNFNAERGSTATQNAVHLRRNGPGIIVARHALSPSTPRAFRRDPAGSAPRVDRESAAKQRASRAINDARASPLET